MSLAQRLLTSIGRQVSAAVSTLTPSLRAASQYGPAHLTHSASTVPGLNLLSRYSSSLARMHRIGIRRRIRRPQAPILGGQPQMRGVVIKVMVKKPKKPNSANRKCVRVRLTNGEEASAYIPGEGHNLQEHSIVLVEGSKLQDVPGVKLRCVRGKYDLPHVKKKTL